jgi:hypothetical protein
MIVITVPWQGREKCAMISTVCKEDKPTFDEMSLARAFHAALRLSSPNAFMEPIEDDSYLADDLTVDGRFNFSVVARNVIQILERENRHRRS